MDFKQSDLPQRGAWAPGKYLHKCSTCSEKFMGDKRALTCADCAYALCGKCRDTGWRQTTFAGVSSTMTCDCDTGRVKYAEGMREAGEDLQKLNPH